MYHLTIEDQEIVSRQVELDWVGCEINQANIYMWNIWEIPGAFDIYEMASENLVIWLSRFKTEENITFHFKPKAPMMDLFLSLGDSAAYSDSHYNHIQLAEYCFWFRNMENTDLEWTLKLKAGKVYVFLDIQFSQKFIQPLTVAFSNLVPVLKRLIEGKNDTFPANKIPSANVFMLKEIVKIFRKGFVHKGHLKTTRYTPDYLEAVTRSLFIHTLKQLSNDSIPIAEDIQQVKYSRKIKKALTLMQQHPEQEHSDASLAKEVSTNIFYLRVGLRLMYGTSKYKYLVSVRIKRAFQLLLTTDLELRKIAELCGYMSEEALDKVFNQQLGCHPNSLRDPK